ncbi:CoF synthetase [Halobacillus sp. A5]|uniref:LuxE/PaaK family acyltransferase n=1 Tax=Halobacillus sp. A5 TaxID=2880263 RepID=UPI0020A65EA2|nr:CoF synthetase [Halobacillus sp. A5]MCP3027666.1 CoF synthetase [Halobacillus sp. A5]
MRQQTKQMIEQLLSFIIYRGSTGKDFQELALTLFSYQFEHNLPYKKYCQKRRKTPLTVKHWQEIPAMPIQAFKELPLACESTRTPEAVFLTSGTTNAEKRGQNIHPALAVWDGSMMTAFKQFVLPEQQTAAIYVLSPAEDLNQHSSLSRYLTNAVKHFGTEDSRFFFKEKGLDMEALTTALKVKESRREPVLLMGASSAYVHFIDYCTERDLTFHLAEGSRIFDTGGFKRQSRELSREELYESFSRVFDVGPNSFINMYGMTELSSQIYEVTAQSPRFEKVNPDWVKTLVLDPETLRPVKAGEVGVLAHYDLANWNSCMAVLTEDMGFETENGFVLLGRVEGSEARGCSIAVDELMRANGK